MRRGGQYAPSHSGLVMLHDFQLVRSSTLEYGVARHDKTCYETQLMLPNFSQFFEVIVTSNMTSKARNPQNP